jgi:hypothetical protein
MKKTHKEKITKNFTIKGTHSKKVGKEFYVLKL